MADPRLRHVDDREAGLADAQAPLEILGVEEELLVEQAGRLDRRARDGHRRAGGAIGVLEAAGRVLLAEALVPAAPEDRVEARARVPEPVRVGEEHLAREHAGVRPRCRRGGERVDEPRLGLGVVVDEQHPVGAAVERAPDPDVVAAGEAEVDAGADELDVGEALRDGVGRAVGRAVVDDDGLDPTQRLERRQRVLASVVGEDDRDELHQARRVKCAIEPASGCRSRLASSRSISPTSRAIPG